MPTGRARKTRMYQPESEQLVDSLWLMLKRVEAVGATVEKITKQATKDLEAAVADAKQGLETEIVTLRNQVNKANRIIAKLLVEREIESATDFDNLRQTNHAYTKK